MFPFALISGYITEEFGQRLEVRILELEEDRAVFRTADRIGTVSRLEVYFYDDRAGQYDGIVLEHPAVTEILSNRTADPARQFYFEYEVQIAEESYKKAVQKLYVAYDHYIQKKLAGDDAALSEDYTGYPAKLDDVIIEGRNLIEPHCPEIIVPVIFPGLLFNRGLCLSNQRQEQSKA